MVIVPSIIWEHHYLFELILFVEACAIIIEARLTDKGNVRKVFCSFVIYWSAIDGKSCHSVLQKRSIVECG